ncbi:ketopantoate reductase family protein [Allohahella sp. A8]|uniref:ketopantoate reductase family protein n=1 Tax=Allohahella sp. A8 TaxID=3141461 RepID=UPI003A7FC963
MQPLKQASGPTHEFVIVGLGAIGTLFAAHLSQYHACRALMAADHQHPGADALVRRRLLGQTSSTSIELPVISSLSELTSQTTHLWVLLCCKAAVANRLLPMLMEELRALSLKDGSRQAGLVVMQNGLQTHTLANAAYKTVFSGHSRIRLLAASTTEAARREADETGIVHHSATGETTVGLLDHQSVDDGYDPASELSELLTQSGLAARPVDRIEGILWNKLALNAIINPLTALFRCRNGELPVLVDYARLAQPIAAEVLAAWQHWSARRAALPNSTRENGAGMSIAVPETVDDLLARVKDICQRTAPNRSSMLQDVLAGRRTEIDAINGYIVDYCEQYGLPCRANSELVQTVAALTHSLQTKDQDYG